MMNQNLPSFDVCAFLRVLWPFSRPRSGEMRLEPPRQPSRGFRLRLLRVLFAAAILSLSSALGFAQTNGKWVDLNVYVTYPDLGNALEWDGVAGFSVSIGSGVIFNDISPDRLQHGVCGQNLYATTGVEWSDQLCYDLTPSPSDPYGLFYPISGAWTDVDFDNHALGAACRTPSWTTAEVTGWVGGHEMGHVLGLDEYTGDTVFPFNNASPKHLTAFDAYVLGQLYPVDYLDNITCS